MFDNKNVSTLNSLIATTLDSVDGYRKAAEEANAAQFRDLFLNRANERQTIVSAFQAKVRELGGNPEDDGTVLASAHRAFLGFRVTSGEAVFAGEDLLKMSKKRLRQVRGDDVAMVFQDPMTSLNPVLRVGDQLGEAIATHRPQLKRAAIKERVVDLLRLVGVPNPEARYSQYPHEFSGGMRQRAMIAMAIANEPKLLIADEPTTALDVTIQAQVIEVLKAAQEETHAATILITHDLGLVAELCDRVAVMYAGRIVEMGDIYTIFSEPRHPYTVGLMRSLPRLAAETEFLQPITGQPPSLLNMPPGCPFHPRCFLSQGRVPCRTDVPDLRPIDSSSHLTRCHYAEELHGRGAATSAAVEEGVR